MTAPERLSLEAVTLAGNRAGLCVHVPDFGPPSVAVYFNSVREAQRFNVALTAALRAVNEAPLPVDDFAEYAAGKDVGT